MGLSRTVFETKGNICKIRAFNAPADGFPMKFCNGGTAR